MSGDYAVLTDVEQLHKLATAMLTKGLPVGFDVETGYSGPEWKKRATDHFHPDQFTVGFSLTSSTEWARYVPLRHDSGGNVEDVEVAWEAVSELLTKGNIVAHNSKFEMHAVKKAANIDLGKEGKVTDTMIDAYVLGEHAHMAQQKNKAGEPTGLIYPYRTMLGLKDLVLLLCEHQMTHIEELWPDMPTNKQAYLRFNTLELTPKVVEYACEDAAWVLALSNAISERAQQQRPVMRGLEHKIVKILRDMEIQGVSIDWPNLKQAYSQALIFGPRLEQAVKKGLGEMIDADLSELNLGSPAQMKKLLYKDMGLTTTRQTAKADPEKEAWQKMSTDAKALKALADEHPAIKKLLEFREVQTLTKSKLKKWVTEYTHSIDGKVHSNYKQAGTEETAGDSDAPGTGRFSTNEPAIQQIQPDWAWTLESNFEPLNPKNKDAWTKLKKTKVNGEDIWYGNYRDFIIATPGSYLITYDYSQIELRMLAGVSQEPVLLDAFRKGTDIHTVTAAQMLGKALEDIDRKTERPLGKAQPLDSKILTPTGWRRFGDLVVGDTLIDPDGGIQEVTGIFPQEGLRPVYEVVFSDGSTARCDEEHYLMVRNRGGEWHKKTLLELLSIGNLKQWEIPRPIIDLPEADLPLDPFLMGALLGDCAFGIHGLVFSFDKQDEPLRQRVLELLPDGMSLIKVKSSQGECDWRVCTPGAVGVHPNAITRVLRDEGLVWTQSINCPAGCGMSSRVLPNVRRHALAKHGLDWLEEWNPPHRKSGCHSHDKFIPERYKMASRTQRLELLRGLMDTDGHQPKKGGTPSFTTTSQQLAEDVRWLVRSLGGHASTWTGPAYYIKPDGEKCVTGTAYQVFVCLLDNPFFQPRKAEKWKPSSKVRTLLRAKEVMPAKVQCISVSGPRGLYITDDLIVWSNTMNFA